MKVPHPSTKVCNAVDINGDKWGLNNHQHLLLSHCFYQ